MKHADFLFALGESLTVSGRVSTQELEDVLTFPFAFNTIDWDASTDPGLGRRESRVSQVAISGLREVP